MILCIIKFHKEIDKIRNAKKRFKKNNKKINF